MQINPIDIFITIVLITFLINGIKNGIINEFKKTINLFLSIISVNFITNYDSYYKVCEFYRQIKWFWVQFGNKLNEFTNLHERSECKFLNEFNLFRIAQKSFNLVIITWVHSKPYFYPKQCLNINIQHCKFYDPFNSSARIKRLCNLAAN